MENYIWLVVVAGGAALLGIVIAYGSYKQSRRKSLLPLVGVVAVIAIGVIISRVVDQAPTAPSVPPDPQGTHYDGPAAPSRESALPATATPNN